MPFVLLIVGLLSAGLVTLLLLNTATASGSFTESALSDRNAKLTLQQQELERTVGQLNTPAGLAEEARKLGMVPGGDPVFLVIKPDGTSKIVGTPAPATAPPAPQPPPPTEHSQPPAQHDQQHAADQNPAGRHHSTSNAHTNTGHTNAGNTHTDTGTQPGNTGHGRPEDNR